MESWKYDYRIKLTLLILNKTIKMTSKFFGNSKLSNSKGNKNKNVISSKSKRKSFAVRKTGRGN